MNGAIVLTSTFEPGDTMNGHVNAMKPNAEATMSAIVGEQPNRDRRHPNGLTTPRAVGRPSATATAPVPSRPAARTTGDATITSAVSPSATISPSAITITRWVVLATNSTSWVETTMQWPFGASSR